MNHGIQLQPAAVNITPYALAMMSRELRDAAISLQTDRFPLTNFLLFAMSIELGLKACILHRDCTDATKAKLKSISHDLLKAHAEYQTAVGSSLFNQVDIDALTRLNKFFVGKQMEYFTVEMIGAALKAFNQFPALNEISKCSDKVEVVLSQANYFL